MSSTKSYAAQSAEALGVNKRTIERDLARGKKIAPEVLAKVAGSDLDSGVVLDQLADTPQDQPAGQGRFPAPAVVGRASARGRFQALLRALSSGRSTAP